jgi:hypothetical protein
MIRTLIFAAACIVGAACASTPAYAPAASPTSAGYSETQIENNRYFVTYRARGAADVRLLQDYALLRAADLTLQNGREWFWVDRRTLDEQNAYHDGPSIGVGVGGGSWGGSSGGSVGVGMSFPLGGGGQRANSATLEIRMGEGAKPDDPNAYDARAVSQNLRSRVTP